MTMKYDGDTTDFSDNPRGPSTKPNDFFSYYLTEKDVEDTFIIYGGYDKENSVKIYESCRPFIEKHLTSLRSCITVKLKVGVNTGDIRNICEKYGGSFGRDRKIQLL